MSAPQPDPTARPTLAIVVPVFDDWASLARLIAELDIVAADIPARLSVLVVDDGSLETAPAALGAGCRVLERIELLRLRANLGHQRALAIGIADRVREGSVDFVVTMDADGEDRPADLPALFAEALARPGHIVVAQRVRRSEGPLFRAAYLGYKVAFRFLTGRVIAFGNFAVLPAAAARRLVYMPECWNHLAASIVKSRLPILGRLTPRGTRYAGGSTMNLVSLVVHGFSAFSVFIETAITRLLLFFGAISLAAVAAAVVAVGLRFGTDLAIPGWATNVFGLSMVVFFQSLTLAAVVLFSVLSSRSSVPFLVGQRGAEFVETRTVVLAR